LIEIKMERTDSGIDQQRFGNCRTTTRRGGIGQSFCGSPTLKQYMYVVAAAAVCAVASARAGDVETGRRLAQSRCAPCHVVGAWRGDEQAEAPPFAVIARKLPSNAALVLGLRGPHQKMNFRQTQSEADDIAEYIRSLVP
jgi:mono/diheme cytochrome c family protein